MAVKHIVLLKVKEGVAPQRIEAMWCALAELQNAIPGLIDVAGGADHSPEGKGHGYTHGFVMTFVDRAARDGYLPHPEHLRVGSEYISPIVDDVCVVDFDG